MSTITDYQSLQDAIANWLDRKDLTAEIPTFIQLCEADINRILRDQDMICKGASVGSRRDRFVPLPDDWAQGINVDIILQIDNPDDPGNLIDGTRFQATYQSPDVIEMMNAQNPQARPTDGADSSGPAWDGNPYGGTNENIAPKQGLGQIHFTYYGKVIELFPDPGTDFRLEMNYYRKVPALTSPTDTNFVLTPNPDIYLYGSLSHSAPFLRDDPRLMVWSKMYSDAVAKMNAASEKAMNSGSRLTRKVAISMGG